MLQFYRSPSDTSFTKQLFCITGELDIQDVFQQ